MRRLSNHPLDILVALFAFMALAANACAVQFPDYELGQTGGSTSSTTTSATGSTTSASQSGGALGSPCTANGQCSDGECWLEGSEILSAGSPSAGLCSPDCSDDGSCPDDGFCHTFATGVARCLLRCNHGDGKVEKCRGRRDLACTTIAGNDVCLPVCSDDSQCLSGMCDRRTALCSGSQSGGDLEVQATCGDVSECRGNCVSKRCAELCVFGAVSTCQPASASSLKPGCVLPYAEGAKVGDLGHCARNCCPGDCPTTLRCNVIDGSKYYCNTFAHGLDQCPD